MYLRCFTGDGSRQWLRRLPWAAHVYNTTYKTSLSDIPLRVVYDHDSSAIRSYEAGELELQQSPRQWRNTRSCWGRPLPSAASLGHLQAPLRLAPSTCDIRHRRLGFAAHLPSHAALCALGHGWKASFLLLRALPHHRIDQRHRVSSVPCGAP